MNSGIDTVVIVYNNNIQNKECYFIKASKGHNEKSTKKNDTNRNQVAHNVGSENLMIESLGGGTLTVYSTQVAWCGLHLALTTQWNHQGMQ